jgi:hypothetical protein
MSMVEDTRHKQTAVPRPATSPGNEINLDHVHPSYARMYDRWIMAQDFYRGGIHVIEPAEYEQEYRYAKPRSSGGSSGTDTDSTAEMEEQRWDWGTDTYNSYLWKAPRESLPDFFERCRRIVPLPLFKSIVDIYVAGVLSPGVELDKKLAGIWKDYDKDIDMSGTNRDAFVTQSLGHAQEFGRYHAIVDRTRQKDKAKSRQQQKDRGERTYVQGISPLQLVDWEIDEVGQFVWIKIREVDQSPRDPLKKFPDKIKYQYRIWTRSDWSLWRATKSDDKKTDNWAKVDGDTHGVGVVPLVTLWASRERRMECESPLADALDLNHEIINRYSELDVLERYQSFSLLYLPTADGGAPGPMELGPGSAYTGPPEGKPSYISPDGIFAVEKWKRIDGRIFMMRQLTGVGRGRAEYSKEERSADAILRESEDKKTFMAMLSSAASEFDNGISQMIKLWEGDGVKDPPHYQYPKTFDIKGTRAQINEVLQLGSVEGMPVKPLLQVAKPIISKMLKDKGVAQDIVDGAMVEMDKAIKAAGDKVAKEPDTEVLDIPGAEAQGEVESDAVST